MAKFLLHWKRIGISVLFLLFLTLLVCSFFNNAPSTRQRPIKPISVKVVHSDREGGKQNGSLVQNLLGDQKCNIPKLDINGEDVIHFFENHEPLPCQLNTSSEPDWVTVDDQGIIRFSKERKLAKCTMEYFWMKTENENEYGERITVTDGMEFTESDFARVVCWQGWSKWSTLLWHMVRNQKVHMRARAIRNKEENLNQKRYSVYMLGFDSLSQMSFRRKLPKTVKFLEETLGSTVLNGYNIVGDGTPQALIPILTGQTEIELPQARKRFSDAKHLEEIYPMIWKNFSDAGYVTQFGEDMCLYATFTYRLKGFGKQPTDHYPKTFFKDVEDRGDKMCMNNEPIHKIWFENSKRFMNVYKDVPRFSFMFQGLLSHDDINLVGVEDDDVVAHLKQMNEDGMFDDSVVIVMADHGHRFAKLRETHQGQLEERMPFFSIALPKLLRGTKKGKEMEKNLKENKEKLTTPFDIHASLLDILNLPSDSSNFTEMQDTSKRSLSVFRPIPSDRTCAQAGIEAHWCTCLSWKNAMDTEENKMLTKKIAHEVVRVFNKEISAEKDLCSPLKLSKIMDAKKLLPDKGLLAYRNVKDTDGFVPDLSGSTQVAFAHYQIKFQTTPGDAIYEVTLFYDMWKNEILIDFGAISHVNKYGDLPHCVISKNYFLATFCVCYDKL